jgi:hypothetical protein
VGHALGPLRERVVFVGGDVVNLYSTTPTSTPKPRVTEGVDSSCRNCWPTLLVLYGADYTYQTAVHQHLRELATTS